MREATLQSEVAKKLRAQKRIEGEDVPDALWDYLVRKRYVEDARAQDFDEYAVQFLVDEILEINEAKLSPQGSRKGAGREAGSKGTEVRATLTAVCSAIEPQQQMAY